MNKLIYAVIITVVFSLIVISTGCSGNENNNNISESGTIETTDIVLSSHTAGNIIKLFYSEGNKIAKGDTILIIDHSLLDIQLRQTRAAQKAAEAQYGFLKNGARKEDVFLAKQNVIQSQTALSLAKKDQIRMKNLLQSNSITQKQYDGAKANFEIVSSKFESAKENLNKLNKFARPEELKKAEAIVEQTKAQVAFIEKQIKDTYIISPINGVLVEKYVELGELALPASSLVKITNLTAVDLYIYVSEKDMGKIKLGYKADVTVDSYPHKIFTGKVAFISPEAEFTPKTIQTKEERTKLVYKVKIIMPNPKYELKSGMPADVVIRLAG